VTSSGIEPTNFQLVAQPPPPFHTMSKLNYVELLYNYRAKLFSSKECLARKLKGGGGFLLLCDMTGSWKGHHTGPECSPPDVMLKILRNKVLQSNQEVSRDWKNSSKLQQLSASEPQLSSRDDLLIRKIIFKNSVPTSENTHGVFYKDKPVSVIWRNKSSLLWESPTSTRSYQNHGWKCFFKN
jgi:hypothetical protein